MRKPLCAFIFFSINRFVYEGQWRQKISAFVDFPVKSLNLSGVVQSTSSSKNIYNLYGISVSTLVWLKSRHLTLIMKRIHEKDGEIKQNLCKCNDKTIMLYYIYTI